ncbi:unnamed protein product, partial [Meganyctiphanes norvegica]
MANVENKVDIGIDTVINIIGDIDMTKYLNMENKNFEENNKFDIFDKLVDFDLQGYENISIFSEEEESEVSEISIEENYVDLLEQIYFKGHITDRSRKKYMKKWRKHKKKRKRICKKVNHFPKINPKMEENEDEQDMDTYDQSNDNNDDNSVRHSDIYNELYEEYEYSSNKPQEDQDFFNL